MSSHPSLRLCEGTGSLRGEQLLLLGCAVRQREFEVFADKLLDVWALDLIGICEFDHLQDLCSMSVLPAPPRFLEAWA